MDGGNVYQGSVQYVDHEDNKERIKMNFYFQDWGRINKESFFILRLGLLRE